MVRYLVPKDDPDRDVYDTIELDGDGHNILFAEPVPPALRKFKPRTLFGGGAPVSGANIPTRLKLLGPKYELPDLANQMSMFCVNRRVIDVIERLQKQIQYFPVQLFWEDGSDAGQFYFLFTIVLLDAVDRERTTRAWEPYPAGAPIAGQWDSTLDNSGRTIVFDKARMGAIHFWKDPHNLNRVLVSEALFAALNEANIRSFYRTTEFAEV